MKTAETLLSGQAASVLGALHCTGSHTGETEAERLWFGGGGDGGRGNHLGSVSVTQNCSLVPTARSSYNLFSVVVTDPARYSS